MTKMNIAVPRTAPMILFHSKESMALPAAGPKPGQSRAKPPANTGRHYPPPPPRHCGEASHKFEAPSWVGGKTESQKPALYRCIRQPMTRRNHAGFSANPGLHTGGARKPPGKTALN